MDTRLKTYRTALYSIAWTTVIPYLLMWSNSKSNRVCHPKNTHGLIIQMHHTNLAHNRFME